MLGLDGAWELLSRSALTEISLPAPVSGTLACIAGVASGFSHCFVASQGGCVSPLTAAQYHAEAPVHRLPLLSVMTSRTCSRCSPRSAANAPHGFFRLRHREEVASPDIRAASEQSAAA